MSTNETALILVQPDDSTDMVLEKMLRSGASSVQLLVPDGAIGLRTVAQVSRLRQMAEWSCVDLTLISSDPATIGAAWISQIQLLVVCDTQVMVAPPLPSAVARAAVPASPSQTVPSAPPQHEPEITPAYLRPQPAPRQRTDRVLPRHDVPRLSRREAARPRPRRGRP